MSALLSIDDLAGGYGQVKILNGVSLEVFKGEIVALLGGNGTGKSTLLKAISGLVPSWSGTVTFNGARIERLSPDRIVRLGLVQVTQGKDVFPAMSVEENLRIGAFVVKDRNATARTLEQVYAYFPVLAQKRRQMAATLSGGQLQMLCIGRGLMSEPMMMMLDEPSAALAPQAVLEIFRSIAAICRERGLSVLLVEQNVRMALLLAGRGCVIKDGVIHLSGLAKDLIRDDNVRLSYLGGTVVERSGAVGSA